MNNLKIYNGLSSYLIAEDGTVYDKKDQPVNLTREKNYKLITDELFKLGDTNSRIVRRFTPEDIKRMWNSQKVIDIPGAVKHSLKVSSIVVNEVSFGKKQSGEVVEISIDSNKRSAFEKGLDRAGDTPMYSEDKKKASRRTVKSNPKTQKSLKEKVSKAIKETQEPAVVLVVVNGAKYKSARLAAKALNISVNTVLRKAKANKDGFSFLEK